MSEGRILPHSVEAEHALLGGLLLNNNSFEEVVDILSEEHFFVPRHAKIFGIIQKLIEQGLSADPITVKDHFDDADILPFLLSLVESVITMYSVASYARIIYEMYVCRQIILISEEASVKAQNFSLGESAVEHLEELESKLFNLAEYHTANRGFMSFSAALGQAVHTAEEAHNSDKHITGLTTGFLDLDNLLGGLHSSDLVIVAGRPSMGKTAFAMNIAYNAAFAKMNGYASGGSVAFFSLEMSSEQLAQRILSQETGITSDKIRRGGIASAEMWKLRDSLEKLHNLPLFIDDTPALSVAALRTRARRLHRQHGVSLIVVDYLQLLHSNSRENRVQEISEITRGLKCIAKEMNVPVIALSQLSRAVEAREDKRPQLADLRESGSIEQDADVVMFVYREEYYEARRKPSDLQSHEHAEWLERMSKIYGIAEIIVAKQRHGPIDTVQLFFDGRFTKFSNLSSVRKGNM